MRYIKIAYCGDCVYSANFAQLGDYTDDFRCTKLLDSPKVNKHMREGSEFPSFCPLPTLNLNSAE